MSRFLQKVSVMMPSISVVMMPSISVGDIGYVIISRTELGVVAALLDHLDRLVQSIGVSVSDIRLVPEQQTVQEHTHKLKTHKTLQKAR